MSEIPSQQKATPARRKHGRQSTRSAAHKAYASENDAATTSRYGHAPQTPSKGVLDPKTGADFYSSKASSTKSGSKNKSKSRSGLIAPDSVPVGGQTPPQRSVSIKPGANAAFAGATFHASPAPSALPIPRFLSKSSAESPVPSERDIVQEPSPPTTDQDAPTPFRPSSLPKPNESPLDFMFRAHREEKKRHFQENGLVQHDTPKSPGTLPQFDMNGQSRSWSLPHQRRTHLRQQTSGIDTSELDGTPGRPMGPAFSTPYQERIKAARSGTSSTSPGSRQNDHGSVKTPEAGDPTDALKKFLFGTLGSTTGNSFARPAEPKSPTQMTPGSNNVMPSVTEAKPTEARIDNIEAMENDLRRILKLDVSSKSTSTNPAFMSR
ncbi:hypothetical protein QQS21_007853 [Conoideocrella luteorostrata]|uniref:Proteophosphoglycan 5 n=1 Tax=Conoideocrella luteorostrata TaxID=1105319 RepID=A0AAJ0FWK9_9HYPO|nr:hypothetical protein QQS21_007853 [Conoideocrella luteorostrata]